MAQFHAERFGDAAATTARALELRPRDRPDRAAGDAARRCARWRCCSCSSSRPRRPRPRPPRTPRACRASRTCVHFALWIRALVHDARGEATGAERAVHEGTRLTALIEPSKLTRTAACDFAALDEDPRRALRRDARRRRRRRSSSADPTWQPRLLLRHRRGRRSRLGELDDAERWAERAAALCGPRCGLPAGVAARGDRVRRGAARPRRRGRRGGAWPRRRSRSASAPRGAVARRWTCSRRGSSPGARWPRPATRAPARCCSASRRTPAWPARTRCTTPPGASCASAARASRRPTRRAARRDTTLSEREREIADARQRGALQQAGRRDALPEREDDRERADDDLRQARRALTRRAEPPLRPRRSSGGRAGSG